VTRDERLSEIALATTLGPICLLWGIVEEDGKLACECAGRVRNCSPGKHPRREEVTLDFQKIADWLERYPSANFGVMMGQRVIAVDADIRPQDGKHGVAVLESLEMDAGSRIPSTVTVLSGRANGSRHLFFQRPHVALESLYSPFSGVDLIRSGFVVAPGSRHVSGRYYRFDDECSPLHGHVAPMPEFLVAAFQRSYVPLSGDISSVTPGRRRPDYVVERQIKRDRIAGPLFTGRRVSRNGEGKFDRSRDDFSLCKYLAFYTSHHWDQYCRMFTQSDLYGGKGDQQYIERTLRNAFMANPVNWTEKKRLSRATGAKKGRKLAPDTMAVLAAHQHNPQLDAVETANQVGCTASKVRNILYRLRSGFYPLPSHNADCLHTGGITQTNAEPVLFDSVDELAPEMAKPVPSGTPLDANVVIA
jgi:hypothetical protein